MSHATPTPPALSPADRRAYERNLPKYYLFTFLSELLIWLPIWVAYLLIQRDLSLTQIAVLDAPFWLVVAFAEVPTGAVADRWGRKTSLWLGAIIYAAALAAFGAAPTLAWIMASYLIWAIALTLFSGANAALLYDTLKALGREREYEKHFGRAVAIGQLGLVIGALSGAPLAAETSLNTPIFIGAGLLVAAALVATTFKEPPRHETGAQLGYLDGMKASLRTVWRVRTVRYLIPFSAVLTASAFATDYLTQPFLLAHDIAVGFSFSALQVPIFVAAIVGGLTAFRMVRRFGEVRPLVVLLLGVVGAYAGLAVWHSLGAIGLLAVTGLMRAAVLPIVSGYINRRVPSDQRATVLSINQLAFGLLLAPLVPLLGITADDIGLPTAFGVAGLAVGVLGGITGLAWARVHRSGGALRPPQAPSVETLYAIARGKPQSTGPNLPPAGTAASALPAVEPPDLASLD